jgi:hypothetical protein
VGCEKGRWGRRARAADGRTRRARIVAAVFIAVGSSYSSVDGCWRRNCWAKMLGPRVATEAAAMVVLGRNMV